MKSNERKIRVAFQGEHGAFSETAALWLLGESIETKPRPTFESLFEAINENEADLILAPVENTLAGTVHRSYELLIESGLHVIGECIIPIEHNLIGCDDSDLDSICVVESHPVALAQCENFFVANPQIERRASNDTAASVRRVVESRDKSIAAIASKRAAEVYGGKILKANIEDHKENYTRFFLLSNELKIEPEADKISLVVRLSHKPGALHNALKPFAEKGINLLKIESSPIKGTPWEYQFYLDLQSHIETKDMKNALEELGENTTEIKILGCYKSAQRNFKTAII